MCDHPTDFVIIDLALRRLAKPLSNLLQAELQLNFQKRRGHGVLSVLKPKFSGVLGEALDVAARWSGDVVSIL